jgi:ABC-type uncharacterized transport system permease subunit
MNIDSFLDLMSSSVRLSVPLIFAAYGGLMSERSGVANIALESYLLVSAFAAAAATSIFASLWIGVLFGLLAAALIGLLFALVCVYGRGDQVVIGTAFNLLAVGSIPVMTKALFSITGSTPALPLHLRFTQPLEFFAIAIVFVLFLEFLFRKTRHGLRVTAAGENPLALITQGVAYKKLRVRAIVEGSIIAGLGGIYLSLCQGSAYVRDMAAGRGFIALAALILGAWRPIPTFLACLFFAVTDALQIQLQGKAIGGVQVPNSLVQISPYVITLLLLVFSSRKVQAPLAINRNIEDL